MSFANIKTWDLDDFSEGKLANIDNYKDAKIEAKLKLDVAYVNFNGSKFELPMEVTEEDVKILEKTCEDRMLILHKTHISIPHDEEVISKSYEGLKGLTMEQITKMADEFVKQSEEDKGN